jgi:hypothetical protein
MTAVLNIFMKSLKIVHLFLTRYLYLPFFIGCDAFPELKLVFTIFNRIGYKQQIKIDLI